MKILDTTTINHIFKEDVLLEDTYFITPCIGDEVVTAEIVWDKKVPSDIKDIFQESFFNQSLYLKNYFKMLNKYGGRSFFNMSGFGDISIISLAKTLVELEKTSAQNRLPFMEYEEEILIYTSDDGLKRKIVKEVGTDVKILLPTQL